MIISKKKTNIVIIYFYDFQNEIFINLNKKNNLVSINVNKNIVNIEIYTK